MLSNQNPHNPRNSLLSELHLISIWSVDPIGGSFVDWPKENETEDAFFTPKDWDTLVWQSPCLAEFKFTVLPQFSDTNFDFLWCPSHELDQLLDDCTKAIRQATDISTKCEVPEAQLTRYLRRLQEAAVFANSIPDAGVCVT